MAYVNNPGTAGKSPQSSRRPRARHYGFISLSCRPLHNIGNFFGQTFCSFWRFDTCSTRLDFWLGYIALIIVSQKFRGFFYEVRNSIIEHGARGFTAWLVSMLALALTLLAAAYFVVAQLALAVRRLRDANSELAMVSIITGVLLLAFIIPIFSSVIPFLGDWLHKLVPPIFMLIPLLLAAFKSSKRYPDKPAYMVFHWNRFGQR